MNYYIDSQSQNEQICLTNLHDLEDGDSIFINDFKKVICATAVLEELLNICKNKEIKLYVDEEAVNVNALMKILNIYLESKMREARKAQMIGIKNALEKKKLGLGNYGRPQIDLPDDFIENIEKVSHKRGGLETYRKTLGMKKSTFYKKAKEMKTHII